MVFEELVRKFSPTIKRIAYKLNGRYRSFGHEDLFQEALLHLWKSFGAGKIDDKTDSYILQGCYFHLKNYIRKVNEKTNVVSIEDIFESGGYSFLEEELIFGNSGGDSIRDELDNRLSADDIADEVSREKEKKIILYLKDGLTTREIGKKLGISHVMVVKIIGKIRKRFSNFCD